MRVPFAGSVRWLASCFGVNVCNSRHTWRHLFRHARPGAPKSTAQDGSFRWDLLGRFARFLSPHKKWVGFLCVLFVINQALTVVMPVAIGHIMDKILPGKLAPELDTIVFSLALFLIVRIIFIFAERETSVLAGSLIVRDVKTKLHEHVLRMSLRFLDDYQVGRVVSRILGDTECVRNLLGACVNFLASSVRFVFIMGTLLWLDWRLALVTCAALPIFLIGFWMTSRRLKPAYVEMNDDNANLFASVSETFNGVRVVKTYCGEHKANAAFVSRVHALLRKSLLVSRTQHFTTVVWEATAWISLLGMIWYGGHRVINGEMTVGQLVAFYGLIGQLHGPIADIININAALQPAIASIGFITDILDRPPEVADRPLAIDAKTLKGAVNFKNIKFAYKPPETFTDHSGEEDDDEQFPSLGARRPYTLEDVSFSVRPGECVALVGTSGSGKSTLINLLTRLYDVNDGGIEVDGIDIRDYRLQSYLRNFAVVLQDNFLFRGTIRDNIRYSRWNASEPQIIQAAKMAGAWDFICEQELGLDTFVGERGVTLSGGQKQRLSIARALIADPRILILDEATSALDSRTESQIQAALDRLMKGRTTFIVAHRLSTIVHADKIVVLEQGKIVEMGTHTELLKRGGRYAEMYNEQFGRIQKKISLRTKPPGASSTATPAVTASPTETRNDPPQIAAFRSDRVPASEERPEDSRTRGKIGV